jgi:ribosomal-protein-alanine acetyltransferase
VNIRLATAADIPSMIDLERRCETAAHWSEGQYLAALPACGRALAARLVLVIEGQKQGFSEEGSGDERRLAGFLVARHQGAEWELENIVVAAASRRKGLGMRLLEEFLRRAGAVGSESIYLEVRESNQSARYLYEKSGFEETCRRKCYYTNPSEDAVLYRRILSPKGSQNDT